VYDMNWLQETWAWTRLSWNENAAQTVSEVLILTCTWAATLWLFLYVLAWVLTNTVLLLHRIYRIVTWIPCAFTRTVSTGGGLLKSRLLSVVRAPWALFERMYSKLTTVKCEISYYDPKPLRIVTTAPNSLEFKSEGFSVNEMANPNMPMKVAGVLPKFICHLLDENLKHVGWASWVKDPNLAWTKAASQGQLYSATHAFKTAAQFDGRIRLWRGGVMITIEPRKARMIKHLDQCMIQAPRDLGAKLGMSIGRLARYVGSKQVTLYAAPETGSSEYRYCTSVSMPDVKAFRLAYPASTLPGSSGTPIVQGNCIVGVHTTGAQLRNQEVVNGGSLWFDVPCRAYVKESPNRANDSYSVFTDEVSNPDDKYTDEVYDGDDAYGIEYNVKGRAMAEHNAFERERREQGIELWSEDVDEEDITYGGSQGYTLKTSRNESIDNPSGASLKVAGGSENLFSNTEKGRSKCTDFQAETVEIPQSLASHRDPGNRAEYRQQEEKLKEREQDQTAALAKAVAGMATVPLGECVKAKAVSRPAKVQSTLKGFINKKEPAPVEIQCMHQETLLNDMTRGAAFEKINRNLWEVLSTEDREWLDSSPDEMQEVLRWTEMITKHLLAPLKAEKKAAKKKTKTPPVLERTSANQPMNTGPEPLSTGQMTSRQEETRTMESCVAPEPQRASGKTPLRRRVKPSEWARTSVPSSITGGNQTDQQKPSESLSYLKRVFLENQHPQQQRK
jgi:hypothetical protein